MPILFLVALLVVSQTATAESFNRLWNVSDGIFAWENYLQLSEVQKPFGLVLNQSSLAHRHFAIGHLSLHSFMYDAAQDAFNLALQIEPPFVEAHIGRILR